MNQAFDMSILTPPLQHREGIKRLGYPRVENLDPAIATNQTLYRPYVQSNIIDMDDPTISEDVKNNVEYTVDLSDSKANTLNIDVKPNEQRAQEQRILRDQIIQQEIADGTYANRLDKNVLILYIDNLSRAHFMRKMPKTAAWLAQFVDNENSDFDTYQYFRYHSVYYNTLFSNDAMYFGQVEDIDDVSQNAFTPYSENGYITGFFKDSCETTSNSIHDQHLDGMNQWDHFGGTISCDGNFDTTDFKSLSPFTGKMSAINHCLYGMNLHNIQLNYLQQFWQAYPDNRKFFRTHFSEAHELSGELVKYMDDDIFNFLQWFYSMGYLDDTFLTLVSDHGAHALTIRVPILPDNSRYIENYMPMLYHVTKNDIPPAYANALRANEQAFIGSHDFYASIKSLAKNEPAKSQQAMSYPYTMQEIPSYHDCSDTNVYVAD